MDLRNAKNMTDWKKPNCASETFHGSSRESEEHSREEAYSRSWWWFRRPLERHRHDGDAANAPFRGTDTRLEPDAQIAIGLVAQPQPAKFDPSGSPLAVAGLADPLIMRHVSALKRARRVADITRQLATIVEVTMEYLAN